jgi:hypothetical protein
MPLPSATLFHYLRNLHCSLILPLGMAATQHTRNDEVSNLHLVQGAVRYRTVGNFTSAGGW